MLTNAERYLTAFDDRREWTRRRTEAITFDDHAVLTLCVMNELQLRPPTVARLPRFAGRAVVPLARIPRDLPTAAHVALGSGQPASVASRLEERQLVTEALLQQALRMQTSSRRGRRSNRVEVEAELRPLVEQCLDEMARPIGERTRVRTEELIADIAVDVPWIIPELVALCTDRTLAIYLPRGDGWEDVSHEVTLSYNVAYDLERTTPLELFRSWRRRDDPARSFRAWWKKLGRNGVSLTKVDGSASRWEEFDGRKVEQAYRAVMGTRWFFLPDTFACHVPIADLNGAQSFHFRATTPPGCYFEQAFVRVILEDLVQQKSELLIIEDDELHDHQAHLYFSDRIPATPTEAASYANAEVRMLIRPRYHNGTRIGSNLAVFTCVLLATLLATVGWRAADWEPVLPALPLHPDGSTENFVTVLLLAPGLILGWIVRQEEHPLTKRIYSGYRVCLGCLGLILFAQALAFAIGVDGVHLAWSLVLSTGTAIGFSIPIWMSALYSKHQGV